MYAVIVSGGKQYRVSQGDIIYVEKLDQEVDSKVSFDVLMLAAGDIQRIDRQCTSVGINNGCFTAGAVTGIET